MSKDNRHFRRYDRRHVLRVRKGGATYPAEIVNYSLDGLGIVIRHAIPTSKGDILSVDSESLGLSSRYEVMWCSKSHGSMKCGLHRIDPLTGSLKNYKLADVFIGLQRSLKTGIFQMKSDITEKRIYLKKGDLVFASSNKEEDRLGEMLLREGKITPEIFERTSNLLRTTGKRMGEILVEVGAVTPKDLFWAVKRQVADIIQSCFSLPEGEFLLMEEDLPTDEVITLKLSAANLIYGGIKRPTCIEQIRDYLTLPSETVLSLSQNPLDLFQDVSFEEEDRRILSLVDGTRALGEIIAQSGLDDGRVRRALAALLSTTIVEIATTAEQGGVQPEADQESLTAEDVLSETVTPPDVIEKIEKMYRDHRDLDYYTLFDIEESATDSKIRWAFWKLAKEFHPDKHFYLEGDTKDKLHTIFSHVTDAYNTLSIPERRRQYDMSRRGRRQVTSRSKEARRKYDEGFVAYHNGNYPEAKDLFAQAVYLDDTVARYHFSYGLVLAKLNSLRDAARVMTRAAELSPENDEILAELGAVYMGLGFPLRAKRYFEKALRLNPANGKAKEGLATAGR